MNPLKLSENLARMRKDKKITQEELADFIGVTKASVSKWENGLSMPDILLLPQLAAYFNVSLDDLFGYEPQLTKEQIRRLYLRFSAAFAARPFQDVLGEIRAAVKQYYACFPFLLQVCVLYLNHFFMAGDAAQSKNLLEEARALCEHILGNCPSVGVCGDATSVKAVIDLQLGNADAVIEALEEVLDPARYTKQDDATLIQAYRLAGKAETAVDFAQISMYLNLLNFISASTQYLSINGGDRERCAETIRRIDNVAAAYRMERLHPNVMAQFYFQAALHLAASGEDEQALRCLRAYAGAVRALLDGDRFLLHGDGYFNRLDSWFEKLALGANPPRDKALVRQSALQGLQYQAFESLRGTDAYQSILKTLEKE